MTDPDIARAHERADVWNVFLIFLRLGLTSLGGPIAHLGYFREEFVVRRRWLAEAQYAELIALCQFLPGPASSQVGMALGLSQAGMRGAVAAWCGFTLPSALIMIGFALGLTRWGALLPPEALHGMKLVAVAVVIQALWGMARLFCRDALYVAIALGAAGLVLLWPQAAMQLGVIVLGALAGMWTGMTMQRRDVAPPQTHFVIALPRHVGLAALTVFFALLILLPLAARMSGSPTLQVMDAFYRAGSLVFGGGHVVLPLLETAVVAPGWVSADDFLAGYGMTQAMPGPLFTFSSFLGAVMTPGPGGWIGGLLCLIAIFTPSFLLVTGVLPFWERVRRLRWMRAALAGVNAAVVGLLAAALYDPLWVGAVRGWQDAGWIALAVAALMWAKLPPWLVVLALAASGAGVALWPT